MLRVAVTRQQGPFALDVRFELPTPGVVALFGPSGCGKTTVVNIIAGLLAPDRGHISLNDRILFDTARDIDVAAQKRRVGYVFQDAKLFPHLTVAANLRYAERRARGDRYVSLDEVMQLLNLAPLMARRTHRLSGGERQRAAIGRALLSQPELLLLDEPLASLDRARREEVLPYLETLRDRLAVPMVYVSHQFDEVLKLATHVVLMQAGSVVAQGTLADMSLHRHLRSIIGPEAVGAVLEGIVLGDDAASGLTRLRVAEGELRVPSRGMTPGTRLRVQLLARDIIVSTQQPGQLSVRNNLKGTVTAVDDDDGEADLITIDVGGTAILARITKAATRELSLAPGVPVWALVKSVSLRTIARAGREPSLQ